MADDFLIYCSFCGEEIETFCNAVVMTVTLHEGGQQELWSHVTCLRSKLHPSAQRLVFERREADPGALINSSET